MNTRDSLLFAIAEAKAKETFGTLDLTIQQWLAIYDDVEQTHGDECINELREYVDLDWGAGTFSLSAWVASHQYDCDEALSGEEWDEIDRYVIRHLARFTTGGLFRQCGTPAAGSGSGAAFAQ